MKMRCIVAVARIVFAFLLAGGAVAQAAEIKVLSGFGMRTVMTDLGPKFERATGHALKITYGTAGPIVKRVQEGEAVDVILLNQPAIQRLVGDGKAGADNVTSILRSVVGLAVRRGAPKPDISSPEALKRTLLAAKSISYVPGGVSGIHFAKVLDRLGIAGEMKSKTVFPKSVDVGVLVANDEAEIGVQQIQELVSFPGIEVVGPLPGELQLINVISAAIMADAKDVAASKALIDFLRSPEAGAVIRAKGMEPVTP